MRESLTLHLEELSFYHRESPHPTRWSESASRCRDLRSGPEDCSADSSSRRRSFREGRSHFRRRRHGRRRGFPRGFCRDRRMRSRLPICSAGPKRSRYGFELGRTDVCFARTLHLFKRNRNLYEVSRLERN